MSSGCINDGYIPIHQSICLNYGTVRKWDSLIENETKTEEQNQLKKLDPYVRQQRYMITSYTITVGLMGHRPSLRHNDI